MLVLALLVTLGKGWGFSSHTPGRCLPTIAQKPSASSCWQVLVRRILFSMQKGMHYFWFSLLYLLLAAPKRSVLIYSTIWTANPAAAAAAAAVLSQQHIFASFLQSTQKLVVFDHWALIGNRFFDVLLERDKLCFPCGEGHSTYLACQLNKEQPKVNTVKQHVWLRCTWSPRLKNSFQNYR